MQGDVKIYSYAKALPLKQKYKEIPNVTFKLVAEDYAQEVADSALTTDVLNLLKSNENPMNIIFITGDADFGALLSLAKQKNWTTCLVYPKALSVKVSEAFQCLSANCDVIWKYEAFLRGQEASYKRLSLYTSNIREDMSIMLQNFLLLKKEKVYPTKENLKAIWKGIDTTFSETLHLGLFLGKVCKDRGFEVRKTAYRLSLHPLWYWVNPSIGTVQNLSEALL